jgi:hypothetical protein
MNNARTAKTLVTKMKASGLFSEVNSYPQTNSNGKPCGYCVVAQLSNPFGFTVMFYTHEQYAEWLSNNTQPA